jgi:hypothetical protein
VIGGVIGGVLSSIPGLNFLNCCFCLLNMAGVAIGLSMYLKANPGDKINNGEAASAGAISGAIAGVIAGVSSLIINLLLTSVMASMYRTLPPEFARIIGQTSVGGVVGIPFNLLLYGAFGALGGFLSMQLFFKDRLAH